MPERSRNSENQASPFSGRRSTGVTWRPSCTKARSRGPFDATIGWRLYVKCEIDYLFGRYNMKLRFKLRALRLLACLLCALCLFLLGVMFWPLPQGSGVTIQFVEFTNTPGQRQSSVFGLTNLSRKKISFVTAEPQSRTAGVWSETIALASPAMGIELGVGQGTNVTVAVPSGGEAWRMPVLWSYRLSALEVYFYRGKNLLRTVQERSLAGWNYGFALSSYTNFSAAVELARVEPGGAANGNQPIRSEINRTSSAAGSRR
jgi:hypothetical protein